MDNPRTRGLLKVELPLQNVSHRHRPRQLASHIQQNVGIQVKGDGDAGLAQAFRRNIWLNVLL